MLLCHGCDIMAGLTHYSTYFLNGLMLIKVQVYYSSFFFVGWHKLFPTRLDNHRLYAKMPFHSRIDFLQLRIRPMLCVMLPTREFSFCVYYRWDDMLP